MAPCYDYSDSATAIEPDQRVNSVLAGLNASL